MSGTGNNNMTKTGDDAPRTVDVAFAGDGPGRRLSPPTRPTRPPPAAPQLSQSAVISAPSGLPAAAQTPGMTTSAPTGAAAYPAEPARPPSDASPPTLPVPAAAAGPAAHSVGQRIPPSPDLPGDGSYDVILHALATVTEQPPGVRRESGPMQVIQGQISQNPGEGYYAFISIGPLNVPLVASSSSHRVGQGSYRIFIPNSSFVIEFDPRTEPELVSGFENVLGWFTTWEDSSGPNGATANWGPQFSHPSAGNSMDAELTGFVQSPVPATDAPANASKVVRAKSAIEKGGNKGVEVVNKIGGRVNTCVSNYAEKTLAKQGQTPPKDVKLGGAPTASALSAVKTVVGIGAGVAAKIIEGISNNVGDKVAASKTVEAMRTAPEGTSKRTVHDLLVSGSVAIARVYLAADHQGRLICESAGNSASQVVGAKYGSEAEHATREGARIVIDSYRIIRFPTRLGATTMLKGALKGATGVDLNNRQ